MVELAARTGGTPLAAGCLTRAVIAWSGGKDCAWCYRELRHSSVEIVALVSTFDRERGLVPIHNVPIEKLGRQAQAVGLPLRTLPLPYPCGNSEYVRAFSGALLPNEAVIFGDLFLQDIRAFRERSWPERELLFPLWGRNTDALALEMIDNGLRATVTAVDSSVLSEERIGQPFDSAFLESLPQGVDHCGENGEFHTCVAEEWLASLG